MGVYLVTIQGCLICSGLQGVRASRSIGDKKQQ